MKYYTGTIDISFERVEAETEEELYEKIEDRIPTWMEITKINLDYAETKKEIMRDYVDDGAIERRLYDKD